MFRRLALAITASAIIFGTFLASEPDPTRAATSTSFNSRAVFQAGLNPGSIITDDFDNPPYPDPFQILSSAAMSGFKGETIFQSTFFSPPDFNFITGSAADPNYCSGCNGTFRLVFTDTSVTCTGSALSGIYGVGFDIESHSFATSPAGPYSAFVTFGDGTTQNFNFPAGASFFGITSPDLINNIHVSINNATTSTGSITIDNLTIGDSPAGCAGGGGGGDLTMNLTKTASPSPAVAGQNLTYSIVGTNTSSEPINNVVITDNLPTNTRFVSSSASASGSCVNPPVGTVGGTVVCSFGNTYNPGQSATVTIVATVCPDATCAATLTNRVSATFDSAFIIRLDESGAPDGGGRAVAGEQAESEWHWPGETTIVDGIPHTESAGRGIGPAPAPEADAGSEVGAIGSADADRPSDSTEDEVAARAKALAPGDVLLWGATGGFSGGTLYSIDPDTAASSSIGPIGFGGVTGLEVLPDGRLVGTANDDGGGGEGEGDVAGLMPRLDLRPDAPLIDNALFIDVDRGSGAGSLIGIISSISTGCKRMPDITWDESTSTLFGYGDFCGGAPEGLFRINTTTGAGTSVGASGFGGGGNGLAWDPATNTLYGTPFDESSLVTFNKATGAGTSIPASVGNVPFRINSMAIHPVTGDLYGVWNGAPTGTGVALVTLDKSTGEVKEIGELPRNLDAIAFEVEGGGGGGSGTASFQLVTPVQARSDLSVTKVDSPDPVIAGNPLAYTINVSNAGPATAAGVVLVDTLDPNVSFVSATVSPAGPICSHAAGVVTCNLGTMGLAGTVECTTNFPNIYTVTINVLVSELTPCSPSQCPGSEAFGAQPLSNTVSVSTTNCLADPNLANNTAVQVTQVRAGADVLIDPPLLEKAAESPAFLAEGAQPLQDPEDCLAAGDEILVTHTFSNTGPLALTRQRDNRGPEFESVHPPQVDGLVGTCEVVVGGGVCTLDEARAQWDGEIPVGESVTLRYRVRVKGGLPFGQIITFVGKVNYDEFNVGVNTAMRLAESEIALDCAPTVRPNAQLGCQVHLPILDFLGMDDLCETWIAVQHLGCDFAKASLVTWGEPGFCPPQAAGPLKVECTGLLKPGATWNLLGAQIPNGSKSGILFKWTAKQLTDIGIDLGFDDVVADYMCETLFFGVVGDSDDYRRFKKAYNEGLEFAGVPMDLAMGNGALAVNVHRKCPGDVTPGVEVTSRYNGIAGTHLGVYDPVYGGYAYYVPLVYADKAGFTSIMYVQNGGLECTSVEVWFQEQDNCLRATICDIATLAPGETYQLDANDCVGPDFQGSAWLRTSQPTGIAVDIVGRDVLMTYIGEPAEINYTYDPDKAFFTSGNQVGFAPLVYSEYQGWDSGIQVQNLSAITAAKVKVYFLDKSGGVITTLVDWVCPRGSQTFFLPVIATLPGNWVGSARVESQEWISAGGPRVEPPNLVAIATLIKYDDAARTNTVEAIAYNLLPEHKIYDWQIGFRTGGGLESGVGLVAIPSLLKDLGGAGLTSEVAIANVVPKPGFTDFVVYVYDQNGLLDYICEKLNERQVEYIDLQTWGYVNPGFKGSAVISAIFWEHDVFDDRGRFVRNLVGLGAVAIERNTTALGADVPGDEAAGSRGIPFAKGITEGDEFEFCPMGPPPLCPGVPLTRPDPNACPPEATFDCINCPQLIPTTGTAGPMNTALIDVDIPATCEITDIDVTLDLNHTWIGDLDVDLTSPEGTASELFNAICGNFDDLRAIVDDDAAQPIGSVCSPLGFARYTTQSGFGLDVFDGETPTGTWMLDINDLVGGDAGQLNSWSVTIQTR